MLYAFKPSIQIPEYISNRLQDYYSNQVHIDQNARKATLIQAFEKGELEKEDSQHFAFNDLGHGVLQDEQGCVWWVEGNKVIRQDDVYLISAVEAYNKMVSEKKS